MTEVGWPKPPREPGPWAGGAPVSPPGQRPLAATAPPPPLAAPTPPAAGPTAYPSVTAGHVGLPPAPGPRTPFPGLHGMSVPPVDRAPRWVIGVATVVVFAVVVAAGALVLGGGGPSYPSEWDPRVAPIADWVAQERQLEFEHPVDVNFLSEEEYRDVITGGSSVEAEDGEDADQEAQDLLAQFRALGFVSGEVDLEAADDTLSDSGTLAFYSPEAEQVFVRGTELTPGLRVTLAHELVHVLQDQHFDLERLGELSESKAPVLRALGEGDAERIEQAYVADILTDDERATYVEESTAEGEAAAEAIDDGVPPILTAFFASPYYFGPELIAHLERTGGVEAINQALQDPPTEEVLFNPTINGTLAAEPVTVTVAAPEGTEELDEGTFGPTAWYLLLAARTPASVAIRAADGLGGDAYVVYREDDRVCVRVEATGDQTADVVELGAALATWVEASPDSASVDVTETTVTFRSCDPGADAPDAGELSVDLLALPVLRGQTYRQAMEGGGDDAQARCLADGLIDRFTLEQLTDTAYSASGPGAAAIATLQRDCA